ncbi:universal stress protein [Actinoplanes philippinensis]|uniref:universal stress protein n=1 Tax=Actinoplanes philippinensis TaxID=35752 RepID=UPI0033E1BEA9
MSRIVVGYDGSAYAQAALLWARDEAVRSGAPIEVLHADEWPATAPPMVPLPLLRPDRTVADVIDETLERAVATVRKTHPSVDVTTRAVRGHAAAALIDRSRDARMIVLGGHGHSVVAGLLGSVISAVSAHARCPVVVVRGVPVPGAPVVAGADGSALTMPVLTFAAGQAAARRVPLRVIRAAAEQETPGAPPAVIRDRFRGLTVQVEETLEHPAAALARASAAAQLLVVGSRGHGPVAGLLLGSVSQHVLRHAACTVAVVHRDPPAD